MLESPVFILGVPRSGTTLLRVVLGSHSRILGLPETPWLLGSYGPGKISLRTLCEHLIEHPEGLLQNVRAGDRETVMAAARGFVSTLFSELLARAGKDHVVVKTPDDVQFLDILNDLCPGARYVHVVRDGRDVALSQVRVRDSRWSRLNWWHGYADFPNALARWRAWETMIREFLADKDDRHITITYEDLVLDQARTVARLSAFLGLEVEPGMLNYGEKKHDLPTWEFGSTDVATRGRIVDSSIENWRSCRPTLAMVAACQEHEAFLTSLGYAPANWTLDRGFQLRLRFYPALRRASEPLKDLVYALMWRINHLRKMV